MCDSKPVTLTVGFKPGWNIGILPVRPADILSVCSGGERAWSHARRTDYKSMIRRN